MNIFFRVYTYFSLPSHNSSLVAIDCSQSTSSGNNELIVQSNYFLRTNVKSIPNTTYSCSFLYEIYNSGKELSVYNITIMYYS